MSPAPRMRKRTSTSISQHLAKLVDRAEYEHCLVTGRDVVKQLHHKAPSSTSIISFAASSKRPKRGNRTSVPNLHCARCIAVIFRCGGVFLAWSNAIQELVVSVVSSGLYLGFAAVLNCFALWPTPPCQPLTGTSVPPQHSWQLLRWRVRWHGRTFLITFST